MPSVFRFPIRLTALILVLAAGLACATPKAAAGGNYRLQYPSPAVNTGSNAFVAGVPADKDGRPRIRGGSVDLGPYERQFIQVFLPVARR